MLCSFKQYHHCTYNYLLADNRYIWQDGPVRFLFCSIQTQATTTLATSVKYQMFDAERKAWIRKNRYVSCAVQWMAKLCPSSYISSLLVTLKWTERQKFIIKNLSCWKMKIYSTNLSSSSYEAYLKCKLPDGFHLVSFKLTTEKLIDHKVFL